MYYVGIDPGDKNIGIVICKKLEDQLGIAFAERTNYVNDTQFILDINRYIRLIKSDEVYDDILFVFERQHPGGSINSNMRFIQGYLTGAGYKYVVRSAITQKLNLSKYKDRKNYSIELMNSRISNVHNNHILLRVVEHDSRKHDIADSFNLVYNEWIRKNGK